MLAPGTSRYNSHDLSNATETRLANDASDQSYPEIDGTRVAYADASSGDWDVYLYDLTAGTETRLTEGVHQTDPSISGDTVVHRNTVNAGIGDIYPYDILSARPARNRRSDTAPTSSWLAMRSCAFIPQG